MPDLSAHIPLRLASCSTLVLALVIALLCAPPAARAAVAPSVATGSCIAQGRVTGPEGAPLGGVTLELRDLGDVPIATATSDANGRYLLTAPTAQDHVAGDRVVLSMQLSQPDGARLFKILYHDREPQLISAPLQGPTGPHCQVRDFPLAGSTLPPGSTPVGPSTPQEWGSLAAMYRQADRAAGYAVNVLGVSFDYGLPIPIRGWCDEAGGPCQDAVDSFYAGSTTGQPTAAYPYVAVGSGHSLAAPLGDDESMYHEFGHMIMADTFGNALPGLARHDSNHGGYFHNTHSSDAWTEGFATFVASLIGARDPSVVRPDLMNWGTWSVPLEDDATTTAWNETNIGEELAVAGVLYDLVDGPNRYKAGAVARGAATHFVVTGGAEGRVVSGTVRGVAASSALSVRISLLDGARTVFVSGATTRPGPGATRTFVLPLPAGVRYTKVLVQPRHGRAMPAGDDDPVQVLPRQVWAAISSYRRTTTRAGEAPVDVYPYAFDVADLYVALHRAFPGDRDHNGRDDVSDIFIRHGLFADLNGDHVHQSTEAVGLTSHPAPPDARGHVSPTAVVPRYGMTAPSEWVATMNGDQPDLLSRRVFVSVRYPQAPSQSYDYETVPDLDHRFVVTVPPAATAAIVILSTLSNAGRPVVFDTINAADFWHVATPSDKASDAPSDTDRSLSYEVLTGASSPVRPFSAAAAPAAPVVHRTAPAARHKPSRVPSAKTVAMVLASLAVIVTMLTRLHGHIRRR